MIKPFHCCHIRRDKESCYLKFPPDVDFVLEIKSIIRITEGGDSLIEQVQSQFFGFGFEVFTQLPLGGEIDHRLHFLSSF